MSSTSSEFEDGEGLRALAFHGPDPLSAAQREQRRPLTNGSARSSSVSRGLTGKPSSPGGRTATRIILAFVVLLGVVYLVRSAWVTHTAVQPGRPASSGLDDDGVPQSPFARLEDAVQLDPSSRMRLIDYENSVVSNAISSLNALLRSNNPAAGARIQRLRVFISEAVQRQVVLQGAADPLALAAVGQTAPAAVVVDVPAQQPGVAAPAASSPAPVPAPAPAHTAVPVATSIIPTPPAQPIDRQVRSKLRKKFPSAFELPACHNTPPAFALHDPSSSPAAAAAAAAGAGVSPPSAPLFEACDPSLPYLIIAVPTLSRGANYLTNTIREISAQIAQLDRVALEVNEIAGVGANPAAKAPNGVSVAVGSIAVPRVEVIVVSSDSETIAESPASHYSIVKAMNLPHARFLVNKQANSGPDPAYGRAESIEPALKVRRQSRHFAGVLRLLARQSRYLLLLEDDFIACPQTIARIAMLTAKAARVAPDWFAMRSAMGGSGLLFRNMDVYQGPIPAMSSDDLHKAQRLRDGAQQLEFFSKTSAASATAISALTLEPRSTALAFDLPEEDAGALFPTPAGWTRSNDVLSFARYLERHQARRPPDHLFTEWTAGEFRESAAYKRARRHFTTKTHLWDHKGTVSTLRTMLTGQYPGCRKLISPQLFEVEFFDSDCGHDELSPCLPGNDKLHKVFPTLPAR